MKVYVITSGEYSEYHIDAVALDEEEAKKKCAVFNSTKSEYDDMCQIEEYDTDDVQVSENVITNLRFRLVVYENTGEIINFLGGNIVTDDREIKVKRSWNWDKTYRIIICHAVLPYGTTEKEAKKIMIDRIAKFKAEQAGI